MLKKSVLFIVFLALVVLFVSCGKSVDTNSEQSDSEESVIAEDSERSDDNEQEQQEDEKQDENPAVSYSYPVEGVRPYAVMIDNEGTKCLPQGGLNLAHIIYEIIVEGGETRLMPVFWETSPEMIGPVRSSRHYFIDYAMEHDAIYVHYGASYIVYRDLPKLKINNIDGTGAGGGIFWRITKDKNNWQDAYTSMKKIIEHTEKSRFKTNTDKKHVFTYNKADVELTDGQKAEKISIRYSQAYTCSFEYDSTTKTYKRFRKGQPHMERVTGKQLEAKNIIIQHVNNYTIKGDDAGRQEVNTVGSGSGWFITDGKAIKIKWSKDSKSSPTKYVDEKGGNILLNPGQTWVQITPVSGKVEIQ